MSIEPDKENTTPTQLKSSDSITSPGMTFLPKGLMQITQQLYLSTKASTTYSYWIMIFKSWSNLTNH